MATAPPRDSLTDVPGFRVGHATDRRGRTGCTVILCGHGAVPGLDVRGSAAGLRDAGPCDPGHIVPVIHALFLSGGSAFGLDAAAGVMTWLEQRRIGFRVRDAIVPIVPAAILFDLSVGNSRARPTPAMAARACGAASSRAVEQGCVGVGTGASVGKLFGMGRAMKSGLGSASVRRGQLRIGALAAVNAWGDVLDPEDGRILAGLRDSPRGTMRIGMAAALAGASDLERRGPGGRRGPGRRRGPAPRDRGAVVPSNTTLGVVTTNARLTKSEAGLVARMAHAAFARCISPTHTRFDGDVVFCLSRGRVHADPERVGVLAIGAMERAILRAVLRAHGLPGLPAATDLDGRG